MEFFTCVVRGLFIFDSIDSKLNLKKDYKRIIRYSIIYVLGFYLVQVGDYREVITRNLYTFLLVLFYFREKEIARSKISVLLCAILGLFEIMVTATGILAGVAVIICPVIFLDIRINIVLITSAFRIICIGKMKRFLDTNDWIDETLLKTKPYIIYFVFFLIVCARIPFLYTGIRDALVWKMVFLTMICCTVVFMIVLRIDRQNAEKEKAWIEENNKILQTKLHKSKEILPAVVHALNDMTKEGKTEMEEQNTHKLLAEVSDLYGLQVKEDSKDDLRLKNFCSTGLALLDQQLKLYQNEALDRNVNLDIIVQAPIDAKMKKNNIDQLRLQRAVGDMIRNAFRAIEREERKCHTRGHILLIIGCQYEDILEIAVVDNGAAFPLQAVEAFGRRGITTGGTGNGLADLVDFAKDVNASIYLEEFPKAEEGFSKKLSIVFDRKERNFFKSSIREQIRGSFWSVIDL